MIIRPQTRANKLHQQRGMTLLELIIACAILMILASAAIPVARFTVQRRREAELRCDLREMRDAIDRYKDAADRNLIRVEVGTEGYPPDLDTLVKGVDLVSQATTGTSTTAGIGASLPGQSAAAAAQGLTPSTGSINTSGLGQRSHPARAFSAKHPGRPDDWKSGLGQALGARRSGFKQLGRQGRLRRFFCLDRHGPRRHEILGLVNYGRIL